MLEFNRDHIKSNVKKVLNSKFFNIALVTIKSGLTIIVTVCAASFFLAPHETLNLFGIDMKPPLVRTHMQSTVQKSTVNQDSKIVSLAEKVDYYESIDSTFKSMGDSSKFYSEHTSTSNDSNPTFDDFKASVEQTNLNVDYMRRKGRYIAFSEEEINNYKKEMFGDYDVISQYTEANKSTDYEELYSRVLNNRIQNALQENGIEYFSLNNITIHEEDPKNKYAELDMTINGSDTKIFAGDYLFNIFKNMADDSKEDYVKNINNLIWGRFDINMESNEINNYTQEKNYKNDMAQATGLAAAVAVTLMLYGIGNKPKKNSETTHEKR